MIYGTYVSATAHDTIEYGFLFRSQEGGEPVEGAPELVCGVVMHASRKPREDVSREIEAGWKAWEWMAKAICAAPEAANYKE